MVTEIQTKLRSTLDEANAVLEEARTRITTNISAIQFRFQSSQASPKLLAETVEAQALSFVIRYQDLPSFNDIELLIKHTERGYFISNLGDYRRLINEYRSIVQNQNDSIYYINIENLCHRMMINTDPSSALCLSVLNEAKDDVTQEFRRFLKETRKAIQFLVNRSDLNYLYNGVLQHSDGEFTERLWSDYVSGILNYTLIRNAALLDGIKCLLLPHYRILNTLVFPPAGGL